MAEEKMPWFLANDDESDTEEEKHPQFNADEMEFESFMFDMGQGPALRQSGPLGSTGTAVAEPPAQAQASPFTGSEVPRRNSGPLLPRSSGPLLKPSGPLTPRSSGPLTRQSGPLFEADAPASMDDAFPPMAMGATPAMGGLEPVPQPAPLRGSGPLVDGRTSTGPLPATSTSSPRLSSADLPGASDLAQHSTNPFVSGSAQRTSTPLASGGLGEQPAPARPVKATAELPPLPGAQSPSSSTDPFTFGQQQEVVTATQEYATFDEGTSGAPMSSMSGMEAPVNVVGGWTDSALASVEDFSAVLFALDGGLQPTAASLADSEFQVTDDGLRRQTEPQLAQSNAELMAGPMDAPIVKPQSLQPLAPQAGMGSSVEAQPDTQADSDSSFKGEDLQFESFMFDGSPNAQGGRTSGPLPFWLRNTGDLEAQPVADYMNMIGVTTGETGTDQATTGEEADPYVDLYADLPPIEPFDFSAVAAVEVEQEQDNDQLGFSTGELSGFSMPERNLMTATTDLEAVAHMIGDEPDWQENEVAVVSEMVQTAVQEASPQVTSMEVEAAEPPVVEMEVEATQAEPVQVEEPAKPEMPVGTGSWTAMVTTNLPGGEHAQVDPEMVTQGMETPDIMTGQMSAADLSMEDEDLGISPFSFTELGLDSDEIPTERLASGALSSGRFRTTGPLGMMRERNTGPLGSSKPHNTGPLGAPHEQGQEGDGGRKWPTHWLGDGGEQRGAGEQGVAQQQMPTTANAAPPSPELLQEMEPADLAHDVPDVDESLETATQAAVEAPTQNVEPERPKKSVHTAILGDDSNKDQTPYQSATEQVAESTPELRMETAEPLEEVQPFSSMSELESDVQLPALEEVKWSAEVDAPVMQTWSAEVQPPAKEPVTMESVVEKAQVQPATGGKAAVSFPPTLFISGPLPELEGFDQIRELVTKHPDDLGAHMALAAAYAQMGDVVTELRIYRRVLRKPSVSTNLMRLISEEITDCEDEMSGHPQFHQVRGDLYMRQGRFQEAIAEYNKLA